MDNLEGVDDRLRALAFKALEMIDCKVISGVRTLDEQKQLVESGDSKTLNSKHLTGKAIDIAPHPINWEDTVSFYHFSGIIRGMAHELGISVRWGGDWDSDNDLHDQTFNDLVHFELVD